MRRLNSDWIEILDRRYDMAFYIINRHETHYDELMREFNVSRRTVCRDIQSIDRYMARLNITSGRYGGIKADTSSLELSTVKMPESVSSVLVDLYDSIDRSAANEFADNKCRFLEAIMKVIKVYARKDVSDAFINQHVT